MFNTDAANTDVIESADGQATKKRQRHKGFYLLPSLFTTASLFAAFYAITAAFHQYYDIAAISMFISMVLDGLDGRVARLTNTQSDFGAQLDSIVDMVAFGIAPATVVYIWSLSGLGKFGWMIAFIYASCTSLRLARFNTQIGSVDKRYFIGLASPSAAALVAGTVWALDTHGANVIVMYLAAFITALAGILMVSNIRYNSFKDLDVRGRVPFVALIVMVLIFAIIEIDPPRVLLGAAVLYALSGPVEQLLRWRKRKLG